MGVENSNLGRAEFKVIPRESLKIFKKAAKGVFPDFGVANLEGEPFIDDNGKYNPLEESKGMIRVRLYFPDPNIDKDIVDRFNDRVRELKSRETRRRNKFKRILKTLSGR